MKASWAVYRALCLMMAGIALTGCPADVGKAAEHDGSFKVAMVADQQQIAKDPFQFDAWQGIEHFVDYHADVEIKYLESAGEADYLPNFDRLADEKCDLIWGAGNRLQEAIVTAAGLNPDVQFALLDYTATEEVPENLAYVEFQSEIPAFLCGYIAGYATETDQVAFVGGVESESLERFEYGYRYGVAYAARELGKEIEVEVEYTGSFSEELLGKNMGLKLYDQGCDVIFQAAGECGLGVIEAARQRDRWVIGVDVDQYGEAPAAVLTSALKQAGEALRALTERYYQGEEIGGTSYLYGLEEESVGIPEDNPNLTEYFPGLYEKAMKLKEKIWDGELEIPADGSSYKERIGQLREGGI